MSLEPLETRQLLAAAQDPAAPQGVVVIDSALVANIPQEELAGSVVVAIDNSRDVVDQITTALDGLEDVSVLRVISHGSDGRLWFGTQSIDSATLAARSVDVSGWSKSLTADADILLYGCSVASTLDGRLFVEQLGSLTQADVAASIDATGQGGDTDLEFQQGQVTAALLASTAEYERAGVSLDVTTSNSSITNWTNNGNGTVTVTMKYDISGLFYVAGGGSSPNGYVYMYLNGNQVARQAVTIDTTFTEYGTSGIGSVTRGSKNLLFTATLTLPQLPYSKDSDRRWVGENEISVSPREGFPTIWSDPDPHVLRIEAPYYFGFERNYTVAAGQTLYTVANVFGTPTITQTATGLPSGVTISSNGTILGAPVSGSAGVYPVVVRATNGFAVTEYSITITVTNQAPSFASTNAAVISGATEGTPFTISYAALAAALDDADPNGDPLSFRIESVLGGTLTKNGTPVTAGTTSIAPGESLVWTPPATVNGTRDAFTVKAYDGALYSATTKTVQVAIGAVNDPPTLTQFSGPVATGNEDSAIAISFADLVAKGDEADIDSIMTAFVVKEVTTGTLRIGTSEATATAWNATTNKAITASLNAYWTPDANANGPQSAFKAVARDDGSAESVTPVQAVVTVNPVNDTPTLTSIAIISGATGSDPFEITYASLANASNAVDVDADAISFRIEAVSTGSLDKWTGSAWAAVVPGTTLLSAGEKLRWTPVAGSSGLRNAFTVKAWDGQLASATAIQVRVDGDRWRVLPWTDATSSGITPTHRFTHAYSFGAAGSFAVNGVPFTGIAGGNPAVGGRLVTTGFGTAATNDANNLTDATRSLANDAVASSATTSTVTLRGLVPGGRYVLSLFTVGLDSGSRLATLSSALGQVTVNENEYGNNNGVRIDYQYLADASGSVTITLAVPGSSFNLYGLANREHGAAIRIDSPTSLVYDAGPKQFQAAVQNYATASNSPFISAGTLHSVVLKADGTVAAYGTNNSGQTNVPAGLANVVAVSAGGYHTLALKSDGTVVAWGNNTGGQSIMPAGLSNVVAISAGGSHSLALKSDGTVVAWGSNSGGQSSVPAGLTGVVAIAAGATHSLALKSDGTVVAWGYGFYNYATPPAGLTDVVAISAGEWHSLALKSDGTVVAWGNNGSFQSWVPAGLKGVVAISAGTSHSLALKSDGTIVTWGDRNNYGLTTMPAGLANVVAIDAGSEHSLALKSDGTVVTFGWTRFGQQYLPTAFGPIAAISTGNDHTLAVKTDGTVVAWGGNSYGQTNVPAGLSNVVAVQAGDQFSVALKSDRTVVSWGAAIGTFGTAVAIPVGLADVVQLSASRDHVLALKADGTVVAWGDNYYGQSSVPVGLSGVVSVAAGGMGSLALKSDGTVVYWGSPYAGRGAVPAGLSGVKAIAAGEFFSLALKTDGTVVAWGDSAYPSWQVPAGLTGVVAIEAGFYHALALKADGSVVAWGNSTEVPSTVNGVGVISLAAGYNNSIALKSDGTIIAWGNNHRGQNSPPASAQFPAVGLAGRLLSLDAPSFTYSYQGRGSTVYAASATPPTNAGDYTVTVTGNTAGNEFNASQTFTIAKVTPSLSYSSRVNTIAYGSPLTADQVGSSGAWGVVGNSYQAIPGSYVYSPAVGAVLPLGTQTLQVTFLPTDSVNFNPAVATGTITVTKASVAASGITLTPPASLTYTGTAKAYTASAPGVSGFTSSYSGRAGTTYGPSTVAPTYAGSYTITATVNDPNYTGTKSLDFTIAKAVPTITTNPTSSTLTFGQTLAAATLSGGVTSVPGSFAFAYTGTSPSAGTWSYDVVFTPTDTVNYTTATGSAAVTVSASTIAAGAFTFSGPSSLVYNGSPKFYSATAAGPWGTLYGMNYSYAGISGTTYGPSATAPMNVGSYAVTATLSGSNFSGSATQTFTIAKATPAITWATPASIAYGTPLSATQLNASANVAGALAYTPASGTVLGAGARTLQAVFTPTDTTNYATVTASVPLQVTTTSLPISLLTPPNLTYDGSAKAYAVSQNAYLSAGADHALVLKADGTVVAWGKNNEGQATVPAGLSGVVQVSAGYSHSVAVKSNGTIVGWGNNSYQQYSGYPVNADRVIAGLDTTPILPRDLITNAVAAAAGGTFTAVLRADGTVTVLGNSTYTSTLNVPADLTGVTAIAAGYHHAVALKSDGTVVAWGSSPSQDYGQANVPAGLSGVVAIAAGFTHTLALKSDGTVVAWGNNGQGACTVPAGLSGVVAITAGNDNSYAVKADGTVIGWGYGYTRVVPANVTGVAALAQGNQHALAIKTDGTVVAWGRIYDGSGGSALDAATLVPSPLTGVGNFSYSYSYAGRAGTTYAASSSAPTNAGSYTLTVSSTDPNYSGGKTVDFTIAQATPTITTLPQAAIVAEGQALSAVALDGGVATVPGTFAFTTPSFVPSAGTTTQGITFTPSDAVNYSSVTATVPVRSQGSAAAMPSILTLPTAAPITFGQKLQASTLSGGSASVPGTFVYSSRLTVPNPGTARQSVTFIPDDIASYAAVTTLVPLTVYDGIIGPLNIPLVPPSSLTYDGSPKAFTVSRNQLLSGYYAHALIVNTDGTVTAFGDNFLGGCNVPAGLSSVVAVSTGDSISLALKSDGTVVEWGGDAGWGPMFGRPPAGLTGVVAIARAAHGLALKSDGTVVAWGDNTSGKATVPAGLNNVVAIAASEYASFALKSDGTVVAWGGNPNGEQNIPVGLSGVIAIDAGPYGGVVALKADGTVVTWGGGPSVPAGLNGVVAVAAGYNHMTALKSDGTVVNWGSDTVFSPGAANTNVVPSELSGVVAISAGARKTYALKADGSVVWWGQGGDTGAYKVNDQVVYFPGMGAVSVPRATPIAGASAGFAFTTTYAGREGTVYAASSTAPTNPGDYAVTGTGTNSAFTTPKIYAFSIAKATPAITVPPTATGITYGQTLAASVLSGGTASAPGTFAFAAPATAPNAGTTSQEVVFTPSDTTRYLPVTLSVSVAVARATPALVTLPTATSLTYGQTLAVSVLANGLASVAGTFVFTTTGTAPAVGTAAQGITFTPDDATNYESFTESVNVLVARATPTITALPTASSIRYGQTLADSILSGGTASVPGTFAFADTAITPAAGTPDQDVIFTPTDTANYAPVTVSVPVTVRSFDTAEDTGSAGEAGGTANATLGFHAIGNVISNDPVYAGSDLLVTAISGAGGAGAVGSPLAGTYGALTILSSGDYAYVVSDANAAVQALASGATLQESFTYSASNGTTTVSAVLRITIYGANDAATMSSVGSGPLATGTEDTRSAITFAMIRAAANAADLDGTVAAFVVCSVAGGRLLIGATPETAAAWNADSNAVIDATRNAYWTPDTNATGTQAAFTVVARDDGGLDSETPLPIEINLAPVNDAPVITPVAIGFTDTAGTDVFTAATGTLVASDVESSGLTFGITGVTPVADVFSLVGTYGTLVVNRLTGAYAFTPNATVINAATTAVSETFPIVVSDGVATTAALLTISIAATDDRPTLSALESHPTPGTEDTTTEVLFSELLSRGDEGDIDGTVTAFVVTEVKTGRLSIGTSAATAIAWNSETNALITAELKGYWIPDANAHGPIDAFAVVARDNAGNDSTPAVDYHITVTPANDAPSLTALSLAAGSTAEDTEVQLTFAAIAAAGDGADIDGTVTSFVVKAVSSGTLKIGATAGAATAWNADTNAVIGTGLNAYWTPAANDTGVLEAFTVVARDDGGLESAVALPVQVSVSAVNDAPVNTVPSAQVTNEDVALVFSTGNGNLISIADVDVASAPIDVTLSVAHGALTLSGTTGLAFTAGDGTTDATLQFSGTVADVNAALAGLTYTPNANYCGSDSLSITTSDPGSTGSGGTQTDTRTVAISVTPVNDAPSGVTLTNITTTLAEDTSTASKIKAADIVVTDVDGGANVLSLTGADAASFEIEGTTLYLKAGLTLDHETQASYAVTVRLADATIPGSTPATADFTLAVTNVAEPAVIGLPSPFANGVTEDGDVNGLGLLTATGQFSVTDQDAGEAAFSTLVPAAPGVVNLGTLTIDANGAYVYAVRNSLDAVQALRAGVTHEDRFVIRAVDGESRTVSFVITGVADTLSGIVADGYLKHAILFSDSNGSKVRDWTDAGGMNGIWDAGEGEAWTTTDDAGKFSFDFGDSTATLRSIGGIDLSTGLPFTGSLTAPAGSTVVNPLTTLVVATAASAPGTTVATATAAVLAGLGLPSGLDLVSYDPLAQGADNPTALQVQKAAANVANVIVVAMNAGIDPAATLANLATLIVAATPAATVDLTSTTVLGGVLTVGNVAPPTATIGGLAAVNAAVSAATTFTDIGASQSIVQAGLLPPTITSASTTTMTTGSVGSFQFVATGTPAATFSTTRPLPSGLTLSAAGLLTGTPAAGSAGTYVLSVTASNGVLPAGTQTFTLVVNQQNDITVSVVNNVVVLALATQGVVISDFSTSYNSWSKQLTITAKSRGAGGAITGGGTGIRVNGTSGTITVDLAKLTGFAGISVVGTAATDAITIGRGGVNLAAVSAGAGSQSFRIDTGAGVADVITVASAISAKGSGVVTLTTLGGSYGGRIQLGGTVTTVTGSQSYVGDVTLVGDTTLSAGTGGSIQLAGRIDGARRLTLAAGGTITLGAGVGTTTPLRGMTISRASGVAIAGGFRLDGSGTAAGTSGLTVAAGVNNLVFAPVDGVLNPRSITGFSGSGIRVLGGTIRSLLSGIASNGNRIGLEILPGTYTGTVITNCDFSRNTTGGVSLTGTTNLTLGGASGGNTISRNAVWGLWASGAMTGSVIHNNTLDANGRAGMSLNAATGLWVGGLTANTGNRIINATAWGAYSVGIEATGKLTGTRLQGNRVTGHSGSGVVLTAAQGLTVGGPHPAARNVIQANLGNGLVATGACTGSLVQGNTISGNRAGDLNTKSAKYLTVR
jgi:VCBS repeat-containing protein